MSGGVTLLCPSAVYADKADITEGSFAFLHAPVNPEAPDGFCVDPLGNPALLFNVSADFDGVLVTKNEELPFQGTGDAVVCAYAAPVDGVIAVFSGSFTWPTAQGEITGTFEGIEYPTEVFGEFWTVIFIEFKGATEAVAEGLDYPFGGLGGNPFAAGVEADIVQGELKLKE
jgi:hypothetical protein